MASTSITSLAKEIGSKGIDFIKTGEEIPLKLSASDVEDDEVVKVYGEGSNPDFKKGIATFKPSDQGNLNKTFSTPFEFPGGEDVYFSARIEDRYQSNVHVADTESNTSKIYSEADEKIREILSSMTGSNDSERSENLQNETNKNMSSKLFSKEVLIASAILGFLIMR